MENKLKTNEEIDSTSCGLHKLVELAYIKRSNRFDECFSTKINTITSNITSNRSVKTNEISFRTKTQEHIPEACR